MLQMIIKQARCQAPKIKSCDSVYARVCVHVAVGILKMGHKKLWGGLS